MNFRDKPELQERLAAEYALGTLRGAARRRLQRWMRGDAALALVVARWEARLAPLAEAVAPVTPPARLWREINAQLDAPGERLRAAPGGLWNNVAFWRSFGLAAGGAAAVLLAAGTPGKRSVLRHAKVTLHQPSSQARGSLPDLAVEAKEVAKVRSEIDEILSRHTGKPVGKIRNDTDRNKMFSAQEAVDYGLADQVIVSRKANSIARANAA